MQKKATNKTTPMAITEKEAMTPEQILGLFDAVPVKGQSRDAYLRAHSMSPRPAIIAGLVIIAVFILGVVLCLVYIPMRSDIHVPAELVFKTKRQTVQHLEGGIVKEILVHDGDMVRAGQPLIKLESNQVLPLVTMIEEQKDGETAFMARVDAESRDLPAIQFPRSLTSRGHDPEVAKIMQSEDRLFSARRAAYQQQVNLMHLQIEQVKSAAKGTQEHLATKRQEIATLKEQLEANLSLQKQGYVTKTTVLEFQRSLAANTGEYEMIAASVASDKQRITEYEQRILSLKAERVQSAINDMKQSSLRRIDQQEKVRPLQDTLERQVIRSPIAGKVVGLKVTTIGGIVMPREALMEIVPIGDHMIFEGRIRLEDATEVAVGQKGDAIVSGLNMIIDPPPILKTKLTYLSDDRISPQGSQQPYYAAEFEFDPAALRALGKIQLKPGMSAQISIATKPRTPMSEIIDAVRDHVEKSQASR
jgi:HlyD family type I secretion membrane fusion protein